MINKRIIAVKEQQGKRVAMLLTGMLFTLVFMTLAFAGIDGKVKGTSVFGNEYSGSYTAKEVQEDTGERVYKINFALKVSGAGEVNFATQTFYPPIVSAHDSGFIVVIEDSGGLEGYTENQYYFFDTDSKQFQQFATIITNREKGDIIDIDAQITLDNKNLRNSIVKRLAKRKRNIFNFRDDSVYHYTLLLALIGELKKDPAFGGQVAAYLQQTGNDSLARLLKSQNPQFRSVAPAPASTSVAATGARSLRAAPARFAAAAAPEAPARYTAQPEPDPGPLKGSVTDGNFIHKAIGRPGKVHHEVINTNFLRKKSKIVFYEYDLGNHNEVTGRLLTENKNGTYKELLIDTYPDEGGANPKVISVFYANADDDKSAELFVLVRWDIQKGQTGSSGNFYRIYAYDNDIVDGEEGESLVLMPEVMYKLGEGLDGVVEGKPSAFKLITAKQIKERLKELGY